MSKHISDDDLIQLIKWDNLSRRVGRWPLISLTTINQILSIHPYVYNAGTFKKFTPPGNKRPIIAVQPLLDKFPDCMVLAGGYYTDEYRNGDADIFFYNTTQEKIEEIFKYVRSDEFHGDKITWKRNANMVSTYVTVNDGSYNRSVEIQFILRIYDTKDSIIGGFDLGGSAVLYDGKEHLFTPLGAISMLFKINIVDLTRYSTTYNYRLIKYQSNKYFKSVLLELDNVNNGANNYVLDKVTFNRGYLHLNNVEPPVPSGPFPVETDVALSNYSSVSVGKRGYIGYVLNYEKIQTKILLNMHMKANTYENLFKDPYYFTKNDLVYLFSDTASVSTTYTKMIHSIFGKELGRMVLALVCDRRANIISTEDDALLNDTIGRECDLIMAKQKELLKITNRPLIIQQVGKEIPADASMTASEWYGIHHKDVGLNEHPIQFKIIDACPLSDNIRDMLFNVQYEIYSSYCYFRLFG